MAEIMRVLLCIFMFCLTGCVPFVTFVDYRPQMQAGVVSADNCLGYERVAYQIDGVKITSHLDQHLRKQPNLHTYSAHLSIPAGERAAFLSANVTVEKFRDGVTIGRPMETQTGVITAYESIRYDAPRASLDPLGVMEGRTTEVNGLKIARTFTIGVGLDTVPESDYRVTLPPMNINGKVVNLPPIVFTRTARTKFMAPLNC